MLLSVAALPKGGGRGVAAPLPQPARASLRCWHTAARTNTHRDVMTRDQLIDMGAGAACALCSVQPWPMSPLGSRYWRSATQPNRPRSPSQTHWL